MIFVTVGTQLPFDRLVHSVDRWAATHSVEIFAQIANSKNPPKTISWSRFLSPLEIRRHMENAEIVVAHAGMGSILTSLSMSKRIIVMPRLASLHEHRNDHQLATTSKLRMVSGLTIVDDTNALIRALDAMVLGTPLEPIRQSASEELLTNLKSWIEG